MKKGNKSVRLVMHCTICSKRFQNLEEDEHASSYRVGDFMIHQQFNYSMWTCVQGTAEDNCFVFQEQELMTLLL